MNTTLKSIATGRVEFRRTCHSPSHPGGHFSFTAFLILLSGMSCVARAAPSDTDLISVAALTGNAAGCRVVCARVTVSADGRYVAFESDAATLVSGDTNRHSDVFVRDRQTGQTERESVDSHGVQGNSDSRWPSISADGRYVVFESDASNLVPDDTNGRGDIFVRDRQTGLTERVSVDSSGLQGNGGGDLYSSISADGRYVAFESDASNLVPGDTNGQIDVFVHDRQTGRTERVSLDLSGAQINDNSVEPSLSADGRFVAFSSGGAEFVRDRLFGQTELVSVNSSGVRGNDHSEWPTISADGRYVAFYSYASNLVSDDTNEMVDIFVRDRQTRQTERESVDSGGHQANGSSFAPAISGDGRYVAFYSGASNLVPDDTNGNDVFVRDRLLGQTERESVDSNGVQGNGDSGIPTMSADGVYVVFSSTASNLVSNDLNSNSDVFIHEVGGSGTMGYTLRPRFLAFGDQPLFTARTLIFNVRNTGNVALPIVSMEIVGANRAAFTFSNKCGNLVAVGAHCTINVRFRPTTVGPKIATLQVEAGNKPLRKRNLTGTGVGAP